MLNANYVIYKRKKFNLFLIEQGIMVLSGLLKSDIVVKVNIKKTFDKFKGKK
ncbi:MAG: hypothetical protein ACI4OT_01700 [Bacilli bacterium]